MLRICYGGGKILIDENKQLVRHRGTQLSSRAWPIAVLVFCAVNVPLLLAVAVLLPYDYYRKLDDALQAKQTRLDAQALTIFQGLAIHSDAHTENTIQEFIDAACSAMHRSRALEQHITIRWNGTLISASEHHLGDLQERRGFGKAANKPETKLIPQENSSVLVGSYSAGGLGINISESTAGLRDSLQQDMLLHIGGLAVLALTAVIIVNFVLWQFVVRPIKRLSHDVGRISVGDYKMEQWPTKSLEVERLANSVRQMSAKLAVSHQTQKAQMDRAKRIQQHLLPVGVEVPGLSTACIFQPAETIAGDYYDLIDLKDGTWLICVADVIGHGIPAAMGSAMLKALVLHATEHFRDPRHILEFVNSKLPELLPEEFITMFVCRWSPNDKLLTFANAGHDPGLLLDSNGKVQELLPSGMPLGIDREECWENETIRFENGHRLLLTTDGVVEACNPEQEQFGRERLASLLSNSEYGSLDELVYRLRDAVYSHQESSESTDDLTILALECETMVDLQQAG